VTTLADQKTTELTALTTPVEADLLQIIDDVAGSPITKKITIQDLLSLFTSNVTVQVLSAASGTYTPTARMKKVLLIAVGPGGNGANITGADDAAGGGGGGGCAIKLLDAATVGASKAYTVGQTSGNNTTFNTSTLVANSGSNGSATGNTTTLGANAAGGAGGAASGGDLNIPGEAGQRAIIFSTTHGSGGRGGSSAFGNGGAASGTEAVGAAGGAYGGGGAGGHTASDVDRTGGAGAAGVIFAIEFLA
jgi:hypothetical protein